MTSTTIDRPASSVIDSTAVRLLLAVVFAIALFAAAFAAGRATSPSHTVRTVVTVPAASGAGHTDACHLGRAC
jgi:hypothetical protein